MEIEKFLSAYVKNYIWHCESIRLSVIASLTSKDYFLGGSTKFGEVIDDEW